jgi:hypothetical protein
MEQPVWLDIVCPQVPGPQEALAPLVIKAREHVVRAVVPMTSNVRMEIASNPLHQAQAPAQALTQNVAMEIKMENG